MVNPQSWNRYSYVENDPVHNVDPLGLLRGYPDPEFDPCSGLPYGGGPPIKPSPPKLPICTIRVYDRLIEAVHGIPIPGARHGYIVFTFYGERWFFEGQHVGKYLKAVGTALGYLRADNPERDHLAGQISGAEVCAWFTILMHDVDVVNDANIRYNLFGPNSSSVLRYMLESLPESWWYRIPFMIGYGSRLPGIE